VIISRQKPLDQIIDALKGYQRLFLAGCSLCATLCQAGGEQEILIMKRVLETAGRQVIGYVVVEAACHLLETKKAFSEIEETMETADAILSLGCGAGSQTLASFLEKPVFTAVDTLFLGSVERWGRFSEVCALCGDCLLNLTGGVCPVTRCPKGLLNGPCGGMNRGKCESDPERECAWVTIYTMLKRQNRLEAMRRIIPPRDHSIRQRPGMLILEREK